MVIVVNLHVTFQCFKVKSLLKYVSDIYFDLKRRHHLRNGPGFRIVIWILIGGDKGGGHMKIHFEIINSASSGNVYEVHMFSIDSYTNMACVLRLW